MVFVYLDESGDIGFNFRRGSSRHLIITLLIVRHKYEADRCLKQIRKKKLKKTIKQLPEIKFNNSSGWIRKKVLECINDFKPDVACIVMRKENVYDYLQPYPVSNKLYNYVSGLILEEVVPKYKGKIQVIIDKRFTNKAIQKDLEDYISLKLNQHTDVKIVQKNSLEDRGLQAVDFISGAIFQKYEHNDLRYYDIIKDLMIYELKLFPKKS